MRVWGFLRDLIEAVEVHRITDSAAALGFWSLVALFPFVIFLLTLIGYVPLHGLERQVLTVLYQLLPAAGAEVVSRTLHEVVGRPRGWLFIVSLIGWVWSASSATESAAQALDTAYGVENERPWWKRKALSLALTIGAAGFIIVANVALLIGPEILRWIFSFIGLDQAFVSIWAFARWPVAVLALLFMLAALYSLLPARRQAFHLFSAGALVAVSVWVVASFGFNLYVRHFHTYAKTYGTLGGAIALLIWLYLSSLTVILGGEINAALDRARRQLRNKV